MSETSSSSSGGVGFAGLLTIAFVVLKLCHVINWSWWWVVSPLWISLGIVIAILLGLGFFALIAFLLTVYWAKRAEKRLEKQKARCSTKSQKSQNS